MKNKVILFLVSLLGMLSNVSYLQAQTCATVSTASVTPYSTQATLFWTKVVGVDNYRIEWRVRGSGSAWQTASVSSSRSTVDFTVTGLTSCTNYEARITTLCPTPSTPRAVTFRTNGCLPPCSMPSNLSAGPVDINTATLRWRNTGATRYEVEYKIIGAIPNVTTVIVTTDTLRLTNLLGCKNYTFRVRSVCLNAGVTLYSDWSTELVFSTVCPVSCNPPRIRNLLNLTTNSMDLIWDMLPNQTYSIQFKKATDTAWSTLTSAAIRSPYTLAGLAACTRYNVRLRSICNGVGSDWGNHISVTTVCPPPCNTPRNLRITPLDTAMMVIWDPSVGAQTPPSYVLRYRLVGGDTAWRSVNTGTSNIFVLGGLLPCSRYEVSVAAQCSPNTVSAYSSSVFGATVGCAMVCSTPSGLSGYLNDSTTATITWQGTLTSRYILAYLNQNDNTGMYVMDTITGNSRTLRLQRCGRYVFYLRQICFGGTASSWGSPFSLQTLCSTSACDAPLNLRAQADTLALLTWNGIAPRYIVEIRNINNNSVVRTDTVTQNWFIVQGLPRCQGYYAYVKSLCATQTSNVTAAYFYLSCPATCNLAVNQLPSLLEGCVGTSPLVLAASARGTGTLIYQWQRSLNSFDWIDMPGETRPTISIANTVAGTTFYRVRVSNPNCAQPVFSNSSRLVVTNCPLPCAEIVSVIPTVDSTGIVFNVSPLILAGSRDSFEIQYRRTSESVWTRRTTQLNNYRLTGLNPCLPYEARIRRVCPNGETTWRVVNFTIPNASCQQNCELFNAAFFTDSTNTFRLTTTPQLTGADTLQILWRASVGDTLWRDTRVRGDASILPFIGQPCVNYQFQIRRLCASGTVSPYLQRNFAVPGTNCGGSNCNILIGNLPNVLNVCQNTPQSLAANVQGANYTIQWQMSSDSMMWIQLGGATTNNFNIPVNNLGTVFMRYVVNSPNCTSPRISNVSRINIVACICEPIATLQAINDSGRLRVNISPMIAAGSRDTFDVWYRRVQDATTMRFVTTSNNFILPNTQPCERYEVKAQRRCLYNVSPILTSTVGLFTPQCCQEVTNVTARDSSIGTFIAITSGTGSTVSNDTFELEYRKVSETVWNRTTFAGRFTATLPRFDDCTDYLIRARRKCTNAGTDVFTTWLQIPFRRCDPCALITNVSATNTNGTVVVNISPAASARDTFEIWYNGIRYVTSNATYTISGVQRCEAQQVMVRRRCPSGVSPTVSAAVALQCCQIVTTLTARDSSAGTFVSIAPFNQGDTVEVFYKKLNVATALWVQINVTTNSVMLPRFDSCEDYVIHAMRRCNGVRDYSTLRETVFRRCEACAPITDLLAVNDSGRLKVTIYPRVLTGSRDTFEVLYRRVQDATPMRVVSSLFTFTLPNTQPCETYVVQARRLCPSGTSVTRTTTVTLTNALNVPCCQEVTTLTARDSSIGVVVSMSPVNSGDTLELEYRKTSTTVWNRMEFANNSTVILPRFDECVDYLIRVRRRCGNTFTSWKEIPFRRCDPCALITSVSATNLNGRIVVNISPAAGARDTFEIWHQNIRYVTSSANYTLPTTYSQRCIANDEVSVRRRCPSGVSPTVRAAVALQCCRAVDTLSARDSSAGTFVSLVPFNQGDTVEVFYKKLNVATALWVQINVTTNSVMLPRFDSCEDYVIHAMRRCNGVRDYSTLRETVFRRCEACAPITDLLAVNDSGRLKVTIYPRVLTGSRDTFEILYRRVQDATPMRFVSSLFTFTLPNTQPCETYVVQARRLCISGTSATRTTTVTLTNALNAPCCQEVTTLTARDSSIGVFVAMSPVSSGDTIELQYRKVSETTWNITEFAGRSTTILPHFGFDICTDYIIRVRRRCGIAFSNWKEVPFRRSIVACLQGGGVSNQRNGTTVNDLFTLYPNPTSEVLNLNYQLSEASEVRFDILNLQGQMIRTIQLGTREKGIYQQSVQDISALQTGFYLMTMRINGKVVATQKWQKF